MIAFHVVTAGLIAAGIYVLGQQVMFGTPANLDGAFACFVFGALLRFALFVLSGN